MAYPESMHMYCIVPLEIVFFSTVCVFGSGFKLLAINLVSDLFPPFLLSFLRSLVSLNWAPLFTTLHQAFMASNTGLHRFIEPQPQPTNLAQIYRTPTPTDQSCTDLQNPNPNQPILHRFTEPKPKPTNLAQIYRTPTPTDQSCTDLQNPNPNWPILHRFTEPQPKPTNLAQIYRTPTQTDQSYQLTVARYEVSEAISRR